MKVFAVNGSARKNGNTEILLNVVTAELEKEGIEAEIYHLSGKPIQGCLACYRCFQNKNYRCALDKDIVNECIEKMRQADGILLGSPTYFSDVSAGMRALIERSGFVGRANDYMLKRKVGAAVTAVRRAGGVNALNSMYLYLAYQQMIMPGSSYWHIGVGRDPGDVNGDEEGIDTMKTLGRNMAWLMKRIFR